MKRQGDGYAVSHRNIPSRNKILPGELIDAHGLNEFRKIRPGVPICLACMRESGFTQSNIKSTEGISIMGKLPY